MFWVTVQGLLLLTMVTLIQDPFLEPQLLAGNILALRSTPFVVFHQPALLERDITVEVMGTEPFSISGLLLMRGALAWRRWGIGLSHVRSDIYRESELCIGTTTGLSNTKIGISIATSRIQMGLDGFSSLNIVLGTITEMVWDVVSLRLRIAMVRDEDFMPMPTLVGISSAFGENPVFYIDIEQESGFDSEWHISTMWGLNELFGIGTGISTQPPQWTIAITTKTIPSLYYTIRIHTLLGVTHSISIGWREKGIKDRGGLKN